MPRSAQSAAAELADNTAAGPPIAYSPIISLEGRDYLLDELQRVHGRDPRRAHDDLTAALARAVSSKGEAR